MSESDTPEPVTPEPVTPEPETPESGAPESEAPAVAASDAAPESAMEEAAAPAADDVPAADEAVEEPAAPVALRAAPEGVDARNPIWTVGRRKSSTARIRMFPGGGNFVVNGKPLDDYFRLVKDQHEATSPLHVADVRKKYDVWVNVDGGGTTGQSGAIALGVARALVVLEPVAETTLRDAGLLSRDARVKERKKYGRRGARRGFQFSKR